MGVGEMILFVSVVVLFVAVVWAGRKIDSLESELAFSESRNGIDARKSIELRERNRVLAYEIVAMQGRLDQAAGLVGRLIPVVGDEVGAEKGKAKLTEAEVDEAYAYANQLSYRREAE